MPSSALARSDGALEVALARSLAHGGQRTHAAIALEAASLVEDGLAGALVHAGKQRADHDRACAGGDGLGNFAGVLDASVGDHWNAAFAGGAVGLGNGRDLRHARAGNHARGANGAGPDAHLDRVRARVHQRQRALVGGDVAGQHPTWGNVFFTSRTASSTRDEWPCAESMASTSARARTSSAARSR